MKDYLYAVVIGRFQPIHKAHITLIEKALKIAEHVIIVLGSNRSAPTVKNPWSAEERSEMIRSCFDDSLHWGMHFTEVKDYHYNDTYWMTEVQQKVKEIANEDNWNLDEELDNNRIVLVGNNKDRSSFYLDFFPQWDKKEFRDCNKLMDATDIRDLYFRLGTNDDLPKTANNPYFNQRVHPSVVKYLTNWQKTDLYKKLQEEHEYYENYKKSFSNVPYPVTHVTTDVVVVKSGHVLLIRRKVNPGKGLLALPGGFINPDEWIIDCAFRELKEETRIKVDKKILKEHVVDYRVFDHPDRSLRGRSITHAYFVKLPDDGELPEVRGGDDAKHALWMPLGDLPLHEHEMFEDHMHIISHFVNKW